MKVKCNLCTSCKSGFCSNISKLKKGKPIKMTANKRRYCDYFNLDEKEALRILSISKPESTMRPDYFWMDRCQRKKLKKEYEKEIGNTYLSQYSSTATTEENVTEPTENKEVNNDEKLF